MSAPEPVDLGRVRYPRAEPPAPAPLVRYWDAELNEVPAPVAGDYHYPEHFAPADVGQVFERFAPELDLTVTVNRWLPGDPEPEPITLSDLADIRAGLWAHRPACATHYPKPCDCEGNP